MPYVEQPAGNAAITFQTHQICKSHLPGSQVRCFGVKASWRDDHLRWICGFANAEGGVLVIGRNDKGEVVGVAAAAKLLEDLPNKIRDLLGMLVEVNLHTTGAREYLEVVTPAYPSPISYRGHFYQRSGSTLQELKGVLNAVVHRDYMISAPIQIRVYDDRLVLWNSATLPEGWTQETLLGAHQSQPANPDIANTFFRAGEIEAWGRVSEANRVRHPEATPEVARLLAALGSEMSRTEIMDVLGLKDEKHFRVRYQQVAARLGLIELTIPGKPNSRLQKCRLTAAGRARLATVRTGG
jgi:hypothetical protein